MLKVNCVIASNVPEWLDEMKKAIDDFFAIENKESKKCCCKNNCKEKDNSEFDNVQQIEHID